MRRCWWMSLGLGVALVSCSDEKPDPGVGPNTSWQIFCASGSTTCPGSFDPHSTDSDNDGAQDVTLTATCSRESSGLRVVVTDPGEDDPKKKARSASTFQVTRIDLDTNSCIVQVNDDDPNSGSPLRIIDACKGTLGLTEPGTCTIEGKEDANGYALDATLTCTGMRVNSQGNRDFTLHAARDADEPAVLQIANCK